MSIKATVIVSPKQQFEINCEFLPAKGQRFLAPDKREYVILSVTQNGEDAAILKVKGISATSLDPRQGGHYKRGHKK